MTLKLKATKRDSKTKGDLTALRSDFKIPAVIYGHGHKNQNITLDYNSFAKIFSEAGSSSIIEIAIEGEAKTLPVIVAEIQKNPVDDRFTHVDLHQIRMDEKIKTEIVLEFVGEAPAVKELGGNLIINKDSINVECLPKDLVPVVKVDISVLQNLDESLHVEDLKVPEAITILDDKSGSIVSVLAPRVEKTPEVVADEAAEEGAEVEGEDKAAGEESADGEKAAADAPEAKTEGGGDK